MAYTLEQTEEMASALRALPPVDSSKRKLTKQAVVRRLTREITALQARGYPSSRSSKACTALGSTSLPRR